jgi:hypothetical protein
MTAPVPDGDVHDLTGAYALDALPEEEREVFERHLSDCAACRHEVASFRETTAELAGLTAEEPPPSVKAAVMDGITPADAAVTVQWATRRLLTARTPHDVAEVVLDAVERMGGWTVRADEADERALPLDVGLDAETPLVPAAEPGSQARRDLERHLPQLVEDARETLETIRRSLRPGPDRLSTDPTERRR